MALSSWDDLSRLKRRQQASFSPGFKYYSIARAFNRKGGSEPSFTVGGNHVDSSRSPSRFERLKALAPLTPPIPIVIALIHPRFIHVHPLRQWDSCQLSYKHSPFVFIPLEVAISLFFRVQPMRAKARDIVRLLISPCHSCAISLCVLSPCFWAKTRNSSQSLTR